MSVNLDAFDMFYCDNGGCRVNTFERGGGGTGDWSNRQARRCPGCGRYGKLVT